jgi:hypothetical protein
MTTKEDYKTFLSQVRASTGVQSLTPDESGLVTVNVDGNYNLNLQFVEASGKVLCFIEVAELPHDAPKAVYRDLLAGGLFGKETAGGYFALEAATETVVYNYFFDLKTAARDVEDFVSTLEKILQLCDVWAERIQTAVSTVETQSAEPSISHFDRFSIDQHFHIHP